MILPSEFVLAPSSPFGPFATRAFPSEGKSDAGLAPPLSPLSTAEGVERAVEASVMTAVFSLAFALALPLLLFESESARRVTVGVLAGVARRSGNASGLKKNKKRESWCGGITVDSVLPVLNGIATIACCLLICIAMSVSTARDGGGVCGRASREGPGRTGLKKSSQERRVRLQCLLHSLLFVLNGMISFHVGVGVARRSGKDPMGGVNPARVVRGGQFG